MDLMDADVSIASSSGIPKGREIPRSPFRPLGQVLPGSVPSSVKKLVSSALGVAQDVVHEVEERVEAVEEAVEDKGREVMSLGGGVKDLMVRERDAAGETAERALEKVQEIWEEKVWTPAGKARPAFVLLPQGLV